MLLLSASIRYTAIYSLLFVFSCASAPPVIDVEDDHMLEGEVSIIGSHPFDRRIVLDDGAGSFWSLKSTELEGELIHLAGHKIRVSGVINGESGSRPVLFVTDYDLLPIDGKMPVIGTLGIDDEMLVLIPSKGEISYIIAGPLKEALVNFVGLKVWVWGDESKKAIDTGVVDILDVEGYGILGPLRGSSPPPPSVPSDTLRD